MVTTISLSQLPTLLLLGRVLDIAVHRDAALFDLLPLCAEQVLDGAQLAVLCRFLQLLAILNVTKLRWRFQTETVGRKAAG